MEMRKREIKSTRRTVTTHSSNERDECKLIKSGLELLSTNKYEIETFLYLITK